MTRPLSERIDDPVWWIEQVLHFLIGGVIVYAFKDAGSIGSFSLSSGLGIVRELIQNLRWNGWFYWDGSKTDAAIDVLAWVVGATIASLVF